LRCRIAGDLRAASTSRGTDGEQAAWALEVSLDVETAHAIAPMANIVLVTTPDRGDARRTGLPQMMAAEDSSLNITLRR